MIKFSELSWPVRIGVIGGWIVTVIYALTFVIGFIEGFTAA